MSNTNLLDVVNPFDIDGNGTKSEGYIDMMGGGDKDGDIDGYEGTIILGQSKQKSVRRISLDDTDDNSKDFEIVDFRNEASVRYAPKSLVDGPWESEVSTPEQPDVDQKPEAPVEEDIFNKTPIEDTVEVEKIAGFFTGHFSADGGVAESIKYNKDDDVIIKEVNGVKVGILGIATSETAYKTNPLNVAGLDFGTLDSIITDTQSAINKLKTEGAEVVVAKWY